MSSEPPSADERPPPGPSSAFADPGAPTPGADPDLAASFAAPRRLHPAAAATNAVLALRGLAFPLVAVVFLGGSGGNLGRAATFAALGALFSLVTGFAAWRATSYELTNGALRLRSGVFSPDDTVIPVARIQAIDTAQGPVQRLFGALELHVQTPGGGADGEIVLTAVSPAQARALRAALGHAEPAPPAARRRLGAGPLLFAALTAPQFGVVLPVVGAAFAGADDVLGGVLEEDLFTRVDNATELAVIVAILLGATFVVSFLAAVVAFAGFEVERDLDRLRIRRGLFQRRAASVPVARIDGVAIVEGLLRAPFGYSTVRLETAGYRKETAAARTLFPLLRTRDVQALLAELVPGLDASAPTLERPPARSARRYVLAPGLVGAALGAAVALAAGGALAWLAVPAVATIGGVHGLLGFRAAGLHLGADRVVVRARSGTARVTLLARRRRLQEVSVRRTPFQHRARLATFGLALGSGRRGRVRHLEAASADAAQAALRPEVPAPLRRSPAADGARAAPPAPGPP
jgi:putative membrane protein